MITGQLKGQVDKIWLEFFQGGITNPLTVIEQISFLMFARMLDMRETAAEKRARRLKKDWDSIFPRDKQHLRWSHLIQLGAEEQLSTVQNDLFRFFRDDVVKESTLGRYVQNAQCVIQRPSLMKVAINLIDQLPLERGDTKGDLYEYMLGKLTTAGIAGQFRTPRHIIRAMVEMLDVQPDETVCDPACGTAGFLIEAMEYLKRSHSSEELVDIAKDEETGEELKDDHGNPIKIYPGDLLDTHRDHIQRGMFNGFDFDETMLRIAAMNMLLHGIDNPRIENKDALSEQSGVGQQAEGAFDVVLANPPFKGQIDHDGVFGGFTQVAKTKKTELLFLVLITHILKQGGRSAVVVPDGVLFGSSRAHKAVRKMLIEDNQLEGVVSLPSGVFKPYAGVSTAMLLFTKGGKTGDVWFYKVENDGYSLDDKRTPIRENDLEDLVNEWNKRDASAEYSRTNTCFFVPKEEIAGNDYDLSINRYKEVEYEAVEHEPPQVILERLAELEDEIAEGRKALEGMIK